MKQHAPSAARNRDPIARVLADELPSSGTVLEIASGSGEHVVHFAAAFPQLHWQPSDPSEEARGSIAAWSAEAGLANVAAPLALDAAGDSWPQVLADAIVCINMAHISPLAASEGLLRAAGALLPTGGPLIFYGPWLEQGVATAASNIEFDGWLKARDPQFGLRQASWMDALAEGQGLRRTRRVAMPANNIMLIYRKL